MRSAAPLLTILLFAPSCGAPRVADYPRAEAVELLARRGIPLTAERFLALVRERDAELVCAFLAAGMDPDVQQGRALAMAAAGNRLEILRLLLEAGADPDRAAGSFGQTALVTAAMQSNVALAEALLAGGAHPDAPSRGGVRALQFATDVRVARLLLEAGARPDLRDRAGSTPLHGAVLQGSVALVEALLEHGADPAATDDEGRSPLLLATVFRFGRISERLLSAGAPPLPRPHLDHRTLESYAGRYGAGGADGYQVLFDRGRLLLLEADRRGLLHESELVALEERVFFRAGDPAASLYRFVVEDGRVTAMSRSRGKRRVTLARLAE